MTALPQEQLYTYADLLEWDDNVRYELYDGVPRALASPTDHHQLASGEIFRQIANHLVRKKCRIFSAPFDVRIFERAGDLPKDVRTVLQPDLLVVCDPNKVDRRGVHGAPDLVVEILSPSTAQYDMLTKFNLYRRAGVREYWVVNPDARIVQVHTLLNSQYTTAAYGADAKVPVGIFEDFAIDLTMVFPEEEAIEEETI